MLLNNNLLLEEFMGNINIVSQRPAFTPIPDYIVESLLNIISADSSKVLMAITYLLKKEELISSESITNFTGISEDAILLSINELKNVGVLKSAGKSSLDFEFVWENSLDKNSTNNEDRKEINQVANGFKELLSEIQMSLGIPLNNSYISFIHSLKDEFLFPDEVILMLTNHCASKRKTSIRYMEQVAISWKEKGINTLEDANNMIKEHEDKWLRYKKTLNYLKLKSDYITPSQEKLLDRWFLEYTSSDELIQKAADITTNNLGKVEIPYMEKILKDWFDAGIKEVSDIDKHNDNKNNKKTTKKTVNTKNNNSSFSSFNQRDYDMNELEKNILGWNKNE